MKKIMVYNFKTEKFELATADQGIKLLQLISAMNAEYQSCGHPISAIVHNGTTAYCGSCADDSLRENINKGIEA